MCVTHINSMLVSEILAIVVMNNLEVLAGDDQRVVVVLVVDHQRVPAGSENILLVWSTFTSIGSNVDGALQRYTTLHYTVES